MPRNTFHLLYYQQILRNASISIISCVNRRTALRVHPLTHQLLNRVLQHTLHEGEPLESRDRLAGFGKTTVALVEIDASMH
jgi:hypothetical protein